jgi:hypothetical protein
LFFAAPDGAPEKGHCVALTSSTIQVSWHPTEMHFRNGIIKGYKVIFFTLVKRPILIFLQKNASSNDKL